MSQKYKIAIIKKEGSEDDATRNGKFNKTRFISVKWFNYKHFEQAPKQLKEKIVTRHLQQVKPKEFNPSYKINPKEELIVNPQGRYSLEDNVFRKKMRIPSNLVTDTKKGNEVRIRG